MKNCVKRVLSILLAFVMLLSNITSNAISINHSQPQWEYMENIYNFVEENSKYTSTEFVVNSENQTETKECTNRLIVKTNSNNSIENDYGAVDKFEGYNKLHVFQYNNIEDAKTAYNNFYNQEDIVYVEFDEIIEIQSVSATQQYNYMPLSWASEEIGASELKRSIEQNLSNLPEVIVAVIDTAVEREHPDFVDSNGESRVLEGNRERDHLPSSAVEYHGTHVSGIILNNTPENVKVKPYNFTYYQTKKINGSFLTLQNEINSAVKNKVDVINISIGTTGSISYSVSEAVDNAINNGIVVVTSAGNYHSNVENNVPANCEKCITVAATDKDNKPLFISNYGELVDLSAPGEKIKSTAPHGVYLEDTGTSMAAPFVSAGAAILKSLYPTMTAKDIENRIKETVYIPSDWDVDKYGTGIINFSLMVEDLRCQKPTIVLSDEEIIIKVTDESEIYYTTDNSIPTINDSKKYTEPLHIKNAKTIKAISYKVGRLPSKIETLNVDWSEEIQIRYKGKQTIDLLGDIERYYCTNEEIVSFDGKKIKGQSIGNASVVILYETGQRVEYNVKVKFADWQIIHKFFHKYFGILLWSF